MRICRKCSFAIIGIMISSLAWSQQIVSGYPIYHLNGKIGIGTANPSHLFTVGGGAGSNPSFLIQNTSYSSANSSGTAALQFGFANHVGPKIEAYKISSNKTGLKLYTEWGYNINALALTILPNAGGGNVGIGTDTPGEKLEVNGRIKSTDLLLQGVAPVMTVNATNGGSGFRINLINQLGDIFRVQKDNTTQLVLNTNGYLGIGTTTPTEKLEVTGNALIDGEVYTEKIVVSTNPGNWPDYVFAPGYDLNPLSEVEAFIKANKHLPEVPSAKEVEEKGLDLGSMNATLLKKMEEMTLYMIEMKKEIETLKKENQELKRAIKK